MSPRGSRLRAAQIRITVRTAFLALLLAAVLLPYVSIKWQKERSYENQLRNREVSLQRIVDKLISPSGQLVLFNPDRISKPPTPLRPVVLPYAELQADLPSTVLDQVRSVGCPIEFRQTTGARAEQGSVCVGLRRGDAQTVRGRIFVSGTFVSTRLVPQVFTQAARENADRPVAVRFQDVHRIRLDLLDGGNVYRWTLPVQIRVDPKTQEIEGLGLTAYKLDDKGLPITKKPDFTGAWIVEGECSEPDAPPETCLRTSVFSVAIPRDKWGDQTFEGAAKSPRNLKFRLVVNGPSTGAQPRVILDSEAAGSAVAPFVMSDLLGHLLPGESVSVVRMSTASKSEVLFDVRNADAADESRLQGVGQRILHYLPFSSHSPSDASEETLPFTARSVNFGLIHTSSPQGFDPDLAQSSARMATYAAIMVIAILVAWISIEVGIVRRVLKLTHRTRKVSRVMRADGDLEQFDFSDLRGRDEIGVLAAGIDDLLKRIGEDMHRETVRLEHQSSMLRAIGHEIRSPLQSLSAILGDSEQGKSYVRRMLRAVDALYGSASPSDGFERADLETEKLDLGAFLTSVATNAHHAGIEQVVFKGPPDGIIVRADASALEDILSHILGNAARYRPAGTAITIGLVVRDGTASVTIHNHGPHIPDSLRDRVFEYGVSDRPDSAEGNRGQGLFVAKTYLSKMGGTISAHNRHDGVDFVIAIPLLKG